MIAYKTQTVMKNIFTFFLSTLVSSFLFGQGCPTSITNDNRFRFNYGSSSEKNAAFDALPSTGVSITVTGMLGTTVFTDTDPLEFGRSGAPNGLARNNTAVFFRSSEIIQPANSDFTGTITFNYAGGDVTCEYALNALPVSLTAFSGKKMEKSILLEWKTASETNNDYFAIERSIDGRSFEQLTKVSGKGTTTETVAYAFEDEKPESATNYYRLRQVDYDGTESLSDIITVNFKDTRLDLNLFPTLVREEVNLDLTNYENENVLINILNSTGQIVLSKKVNSSEIVTLRLGDLNLSEGMYYARCQSLDQIKIGKFLVIK